MLKKNPPTPILIADSEQAAPSSVPATPSTETPTKRYDRIQAVIKARTAELIAIRDKALAEAQKNLFSLPYQAVGLFSGFQPTQAEAAPVTPPFGNTKAEPDQLKPIPRQKVPVPPPPSFTKKINPTQ